MAIAALHRSDPRQIGKLMDALGFGLPGICQQFVPFPTHPQLTIVPDLCGDRNPLLKYAEQNFLPGYVSVISSTSVNR